jgi:hypothetical protein
MKSSSFFFLVLVVVFTFMSQMAAQTVDSALGYFPLHTGDQWEYSYRFAILSSYSLYTITVEGDTLMTNGKVYKKVARKQLPDSSNQYTFIRVDSLSAKLYIYNPVVSGGDSLYDSLSLQVGNYSRRYAMLFKLDTSSFLGLSATTREFGGFTGGNYYRVAYGFGLIYAYEVGPMEYPYLTNLVYANINGIQYGTLLGVNKIASIPPEHFQLLQNYPNPFNPSTTIRYSLSTSGFVTLKLFNVLGQELRTMVSAHQFAGEHSVLVNALDLPSGVYFYRLQSGNLSETKPMILAK